MRLNVYLTAIITLLVFQSTNAISIRIGNAWPKPIRVAVEKTRNGRHWFELGVLDVDGVTICDVENDDIIFMGNTIYRGYDAFQWGIVVRDLEAANIPLTGDHEITIFTENDFRKWGVIVDGGEEIYINARLISLNRPIEIAAAAA